jgi:hypothetical protein
MEASPFDPDNWFLHELTHHNVKIDMTTFPREGREAVFNALDTILELATSIPQDDPLAFAAYSAYVFFLRLVLRSLPPGCNGKQHFALAFERRSKLFMDGQIEDILIEAHDSQVTRVACHIHALTQPPQTFPRTAKAAALAWSGVVGKACRLAFSYGTESDPIVATTFLTKLTRTIPHTHVPLPSPSYKTAFVPIPIKAVIETFACMPKKSAPHIDGWTWELFMDMSNRPKTADLLRKFVELFLNGKLPKPLWKFLSTAIMISFHKLALAERDMLADPRLRPITIGALLCRFSVRTFLRMKRKGIAENVAIQPALLRDTKRR